MESDVVEKRLIEVDDLRTRHETCCPADEVVAGAHGDSRELARRRSTLLDFELSRAIKRDALSKLDLHRLGDRNPLGVKDHVVRGHLVEGIGLAAVLGVVVPSAEGCLEIDAIRTLGNEVVAADVSAEQDVVSCCKRGVTILVSDGLRFPIIVEIINVARTALVARRCTRKLRVAVNVLLVQTIVANELLAVLLRLLVALPIGGLEPVVYALPGPPRHPSRRVVHHILVISLTQNLAVDLHDLGLHCRYVIAVIGPRVEAVSVRSGDLCGSRPELRDVLTQDNVYRVLGTVVGLAIHLDRAFCVSAVVQIEHELVCRQVVVHVHDGGTVSFHDLCRRARKVPVRPADVVGACHLISDFRRARSRADIGIDVLARRAIDRLLEVGDSVAGLLGLPTGVDRDVTGQSDGGIGLDGAFLVDVPTGKGVALADGRGIPCSRYRLRVARFVMIMFFDLASQFIVVTSQAMPMVTIASKHQTIAIVVVRMLQLTTSQLRLNGLLTRESLNRLSKLASLRSDVGAAGGVVGQLVSIARVGDIDDRGAVGLDLRLLDGIGGEALVLPGFRSRHDADSSLDGLGFLQLRRPVEGG